MEIKHKKHGATTRLVEGSIKAIYSGQNVCIICQNQTMAGYIQDLFMHVLGEYREYLKVLENNRKLEWKPSGAIVLIKTVVTSSNGNDLCARLRGMRDFEFKVDNPVCAEFFQGMPIKLWIHPPGGVIGPPVPRVRGSVTGILPIL